MIAQITDPAVLLILFGANLLQAITGFAGTLIAMPPVLKLIGVNEAKALLNAIAQISSLMIVCTGYRSINRREFAKMFAGMTVGMAVGICIFHCFPLDILLVLYGIMIITIALKKLLFPAKAERQLPGWLLVLILLCAGIIHGMFVSGGALLVVYASSALKDKEEFRATVALLWLTCGFYMTGMQVASGHFDRHVIFLLLAGLIPVFLGTWIGTKLEHRISQAMFMKITYVLLLVSGVMAIV